MKWSEISLARSQQNNLRVGDPKMSRSILLNDFLALKGSNTMHAGDHIEYT